MAQIKAILAEKGGVANAETIDNKVTSLSSSSTDTQYPSAKAVYDELQNIDGANVTVSVAWEVPILNTNSPAPGQHDVYFTAYPDIKWHVDHVDGDYVYLGLYTITESAVFGSNTTYSGSTIASKCTTFLNNTIPNVADYLEDVTVEGVTNKVFIPTYYQFSGRTGYGDTSGPVFTYIANASTSTRLTIISNDWKQTPPSGIIWLSSVSYSSSSVWVMNSFGNFEVSFPRSMWGFRPEVKVNYKRTMPVTTTKDLNTALSEKASEPHQTRIVFSTTWQGDDPYTQEVTVEDATANSRVDLHPKATTLVQLAEDGVSALYVENNNGTFTANSIGGPPSTNMVMLATVTEITPAAQIPNTMTLSKSSVNVTDVSPSNTFTIDGNYDGVVTVTSSDTSVATASLSGNIVTVTAVDVGSATITVSATGDDYTAASKTCAVTSIIFDNPLNTDQLTLGQHDVYFKEYPDIKWCVDHIDGDYVYLGGYNIEQPTLFGSDTTYAGSTIASKCTTYLNNTIPNVAQYLEDVTVEGVIAKVFIPTYYQFSGNTGYGDTSGPVFDYPSASAANRRACFAALESNYVWLSTAYDSSKVYCLNPIGDFSSISPGHMYDFRPEVKVRYKK